MNKPSSNFPYSKLTQPKEKDSNNFPKGIRYSPEVIAEKKRDYIYRNN